MSARTLPFPLLSAPFVLHFSFLFPTFSLLLLLFPFNSYIYVFFSFVLSLYRVRSLCTRSSLPLPLSRQIHSFQYSPCGFLCAPILPSAFFASASFKLLIPPRQSSLLFLHQPNTPVPPRLYALARMCIYMGSRFITIWRERVKIYIKHTGKNSRWLWTTTIKL